ncbi:MAG: DUF4145 domain-containing protein [Desulfobaccales bacterium]|nr:DUF4145 domain-containing protein [Desulfobaccales bacterium]
MGESSFDVFCPKCNILVEARVIAEGHGGFRSNAINPIDEVDTDYHGDLYFVCLCRRCSQPFLIRQSLYGIPGEFESITDESVLYPTESKLIQETLPKSVKIAYDQAARSFNASLFEPCVLMCRKCLEAVCKTLGAQGRDLSKRLVSLSEAGHIDSRLLSWAHEIRLVGNEAAHEMEVPVTQEDARDILDFTEAILIYVFSLTNRFDSFKARRTKSDTEEGGMP